MCKYFPHVIKIRWVDIFCVCVFAYGHMPPCNFQSVALMTALICLRVETSNDLFWMW